jgi:succinyl-diaminopimelate desuccinylase
MPALSELIAQVWDNGNDYFPATSFQISNIHAGTGAGNVIPGEIVVDFNFRFCTEATPESLKARVQSILGRHNLSFELDWNLSGLPFLTPKGPLSEALARAIESQTGQTPELSTTGGTSDGRFIAQICPQVIEFGPTNATIHQVNESIEIAQLEPLKNVYRNTLENLLVKP